MQLEGHTKQITLPSFANLPQPHHYPTPAPTPHHLSCGRSSALRSSLDTPDPLSSYVAHRHMHRAGVTREQSHTHTVQVPLSALSSPKAQLGAVGGPFSSTSKVKCVPLPAIYNQHQITQRGVRNISLHSHRYIPSSRRAKTVSDSLLVLPQLVNRQKEHLKGCNERLKTSRSLKMAGEVVPHRVEKAFYMSGHSAQLFDRQEIPQEEVRRLQNMVLSQNPSLYYGKGKGIKSIGIKSRTVQKFETKLKEVNHMSQQYGLEEVSFDAGRYSRASRALSPSSPIPEEDLDLLLRTGAEEEEDSKRKKTLSTGSRGRQRTGS